MSCVLDVDDCPLHNTVHDITMFSKYYDPIYHPQCYPEIFESPMAVKQWIESALNSHVLDCCCTSKKMHEDFVEISTSSTTDATSSDD